MRAQASTTTPADRGPFAAGRRLRAGRAALAALAAGAMAFAAGGSPASAAAPKWGYEQISPADGNSLGVNGLAVSPDMSTVVAGTRMVPMPGMPWDGRTGPYVYALPRGGKPWTLGPVTPGNGPLQVTYVQGISRDGLRMFYFGTFPVLGQPSGVYRVDAQGAAENMDGGLSTSIVTASDDLDSMAFRSGSAGSPVYVSRPGSAPVVVSVDNDGAPMTTTTIGGSSAGGIFDGVLKDHAYAGDGSSVIFGSTDSLPGDDDGGSQDLYRRILTPGAERTIPITDANGSGDADAGTDARYRWATKDQRRIFFVTRESLDPGDTDGQDDVYVRTGETAPVWVSRGEVVDGSPTGNGQDPDTGAGYFSEWSMSSPDGNRTYFVTTERLTQDAPGGPRTKLYERDLAEGRTRLVAGPLAESDVNRGGPEDGGLIDVGLPDLGLRGIRVIPGGVVFTSRAALTGSADGTAAQVFVWTRGGGLVQISKPAADAPPSPIADASIVPHNASGETPAAANELQPIRGGRVVSDDGSRVFFTTMQSLTAEDTDVRYRDLYMWTADGGVRLVTPPGSAPADVGYLDSSPDGTKVYFSSGETILPGDTDPGAVDVYLAILGGGSAPGKPAPDADPEVCRGEACQGPVGGPAPPPSIGSLSFAGLGSLPAAADPVARSVRIGKAKTVTGSVATVKVRVPKAGRISVAGTSLRSASVSVTKAGTYTVKITLSSAAKRSLKRKRTLKINARVLYEADGGESVTQTVPATFKQPKTKPATTRKGGR